MRVTELPIGTWTDDYKKYIEDCIDVKSAESTDSSSSKSKPVKTKKQPINQIKDYVDMSTDTVVDITITFAPGVISSLKDEFDENKCSALEKLLKLYTTRSITNMHVFDENEKLVKYNNVEDLIDSYMKVRMSYYVKRKAYQVVAMEKESAVMSNKARFITELLEDTLDLRKKKTVEVSAILKSRKYDVIDEDTDYKYLVRLPMDSVTEENIAKIIKDRDTKLGELSILKSTTETQLWLNELAQLRAEYMNMTEKNKKSVSVSAGAGAVSDANTKKKFKVVNKK